MSGLLAGKVWQSNLDARLKPLAAALADIANDDGTSIHPSIEYIAWLLGDEDGKARTRTIQRGISELKRMGILVVIKNPRGGRNLTVHYRMNEEKFPKRISWKDLRKGVNLSPFPSQKGDTDKRKGDISDTERVTPVSPDPLVGSVSNTRQNSGPALSREVVQEKPRSKTLDPPINPPYLGVEFLSALSQFESAQKDLRCPVGPTRRKALYGKLGVWGEKVATFELLRAVEHGWKGVFREAQNSNGNGHKPADDYRGPGRNTESDAARRKRENCPDCNGTNTRLIPVAGQVMPVSATCKHENSPV